MPFLDSLDVANRCMQHLGEKRIRTVDEDSKRNDEVAFAYDTVRQAELRRNIWTFSIRRAILRAIGSTTRILAPRAWDDGITYLPGSIVKDANGILWSSTIADNRNNEPGVTTAWDQYFGPMTAEEYDEDVTYHAGELVYVEGANEGSFVVYVSLVNDNDDEPSAGTAWDTDTLYSLNDVVRYGGAQWRSVIPVNRGITPASGPSDFDIDVTYSAAQTVTASDGFIYSSVAGSNIGNDPSLDSAGSYWTNTGVAHAWKSVPTLQQSATTWLPVYADLKNITFMSPFALAGNSYHLPAGFLRVAPKDSRANRPTYLGGPGGIGFSDWEIEGKFLTTSETPTLLIRFAADVTDVSVMDALFCEGFAARLALATCEAITQSTGKFQMIGAAYKTFMTEARTVNAIEQGSIDPPEDDFITVRM